MRTMFSIVTLVCILFKLFLVFFVACGVGSSDLEVNPEARATCVSRAGTGMPMMMHLHQEGKPLTEVLEELPQELLLMTRKRTYAQVVAGHRPSRSEKFELLTPCSKTL